MTEEKMRRRAFTLVELLTVIAIIAILFAIMMPVAKAARAAAFQYNASNAIKQLGTATGMYAADYDDTAPLAYYSTPTGMQTWFGRGNWAGIYNPQESLLGTYSGNRTLKDPTHHAKAWLGDNSGFGYNWGQIGSDAHIPGGWSDGWYCYNAAKMSELSNPSNTIMFATSAYVNVTWQPGGDGETYDYGFIFEPYYWNGNPPIDFRHHGTRKIDPVTKQITNPGNGLAVMADGRTKSIKQKGMKDDMFLRFTVQE
jgi:prepilin-type N-terminal cleavage/methylation domain-containing protein